MHVYIYVTHTPVYIYTNTHIYIYTYIYIYIYVYIYIYIYIYRYTRPIPYPSNWDSQTCRFQWWWADDEVNKWNHSAGSKAHCMRAAIGLNCHNQPWSIQGTIYHRVLSFNTKIASSEPAENPLWKSSWIDPIIKQDIWGCIPFSWYVTTSV